MRISIVGTSGSGKSTLGRELGQLLHISYVELDSIHWLPNWEHRSITAFRSKVTEALAGADWVCDGNYSSVRDLVWGQAEVVIFLNYPFFLVLRRVVWRTILRVVNRKHLFAGNVEGFRQSFLSRDSVILWMIKTWRRRRKEYPRLMRELGSRGVQVLELRWPKPPEKIAKQLTVSAI